MPKAQQLPITAAEYGRASGELAAGMAVCIRGRLFGLGVCDRHHLLRDGFSDAEIDRFYDAACDLIVRRS